MYCMCRSGTCNTRRETYLVNSWTRTPSSGDSQHCSLLVHHPTYVCTSADSVQFETASCVVGISKLCLRIGNFGCQKLPRTVNEHEQRRWRQLKRNSTFFHRFIICKCQGQLLKKCIKLPQDGGLVIKQSMGLAQVNFVVLLNWALSLQSCLCFSLC